MTILRRFLGDRRRGLIGWTIGITAGLGLQNAFYPSFKEQAELLENVPEDLLELFGVSASAPISSPPGWLQAQVFALLPILVAIYAVSLGARALATSEEDGTLELLLANPVERLTVALERYWAFVVLVSAVGLTSCLLILASTPPLGLTEDVSIPGYFAATLGSVELGLLFGSITFGIGALTGRRSLALVTGASFAAGGYVLNGLAATVEAARPLRFITPFHWFLGRNMLAEGIAIEALTLPVALAAVFAALGIWGFLRRDLRSA